MSTTKWTKHPTKTPRHTRFRIWLTTQTFSVQFILLPRVLGAKPLDNEVMEDSVDPIVILSLRSRMTSSRVVGTPRLQSGGILPPFFSKLFPLFFQGLCLRAVFFCDRICRNGYIYILYKKGVAMNNKKDVTTNLLTPKIRKRIAQSVARFANCNLRECENVYVNRIHSSAQRWNQKQQHSLVKEEIRRSSGLNSLRVGQLTTVIPYLLQKSNFWINPCD